MKKTFQLLFFGILSITFLLGCKSNPQNSNSVSHEDSMKIKAWDILFKPSPHGTMPLLFDNPINSKYATVCIDKFNSSILNTTAVDINVLKTLKTKCVTFGSQYLGNWIIQVLAASPDFKNVDICFGIYIDPTTDPNHNNYGVESTLISEYAKRAGRLTVFLWPKTSSGERLKSTTGGDIDPINLGQLDPPLTDKK